MTLLAFIPQFLQTLVDILKHKHIQQPLDFLDAQEILHFTTMFSSQYVGMLLGDGSYGGRRAEEVPGTGSASAPLSDFAVASDLFFFFSRFFLNGSSTS